jgi:hypothetical protein
LSTVRRDINWLMLVLSSNTEQIASGFIDNLAGVTAAI